jgi:lysozyme
MSTAKPTLAPPNNLIDQIKRDEGYSPTAYRDSRGILTIGYGFNIETAPIPDDVSNYWLISKVAAVQRALSAQLPWSDGLDAPRRAVLQNMAYNLGVVGLLAFGKMLTAAHSGNWTLAAAEMRASKWAEQVGPRAVRLIAQMETGEWH